MKSGNKMKGARWKLLAPPHSSNLTTRSGVQRQDQSLLTAPPLCHDHTRTPKIFTQRDLPKSCLRRKVHASTTYWPHEDRTLGCVSVALDRLVWGALEQAPGHNRALTTLGLLSKWKLLLRPPKQITISTRSHWQWRLDFNQSQSPLSGWDHSTENHKMISTH